VIRAQSDEASIDDPFDRKNQRVQPSEERTPELARELLSRGAAEFKNERYAEAKSCFEQAVQKDQTCMDGCREQWAYCIIACVSKSMDQPGVLPGKLPELKQQVEGAIRMAPTKMMAVGQTLLEQLDKRTKEQGAGRPLLTRASRASSNLGANKEGWQVTETANFRIFHRQDQAFPNASPRSPKRHGRICIANGSAPMASNGSRSTRRVRRAASSFSMPTPPLTRK